jgi:cytochrome d ubiquinol oxidase subunit I
VAMGPAGIIAMLSGWMTTEIGRQPWVVYGVMRNADAASHHSAAVLSASLLMFVLVYFAVFGTGIIYLLKVVAVGPDRSPPISDADHPRQRPARPLSAAPGIDPLSAGE